MADSDPHGLGYHDVGRRLAELAVAAGCDVRIETSDTHTWDGWNPDAPPAETSADHRPIG